MNLLVAPTAPPRANRPQRVHMYFMIELSIPMLSSASRKTSSSVVGSVSTYTPCGYVSRSSCEDTTYQCGRGQRGRGRAGDSEAGLRTVSGWLSPVLSVGAGLAGRVEDSVAFEPLVEAAGCASTESAVPLL